MEVGVFEKKNGFEFSEKAKEDFRLVDQALTGDEHAYAQLLARYRDTMLHMIRRMVKNEHDAEDLTMATFGKAFRCLSLYKPESAFSAWLFKIATNNVMDYMRRRTHRMVSIDDQSKSDDDASPVSGVPVLMENSDDPEESFIRGQKIEYARQILAQLPKDYREITIMRYYKDKSYIDISEALGIPMGTVKARIHRAHELMLATLATCKLNNQDRI